jgi:hypothetical protein
MNREVWPRALAALLLILPFLPFFAGFVPKNDLAGAALLGLAAIVAPGLAGVAQPGVERAPHVALRFLAGAFLLNLAAMITRRILGIDASPMSYAAILAAWTVPAGVAGVIRGGRFPVPHLATVAVGIAAFLASCIAGTRIVPPLEDQDMETQGTAYGLITNLEPLSLTNRSTLYFFAHPPLLHVLNAPTLLLAGQLESVRAAYDAARAERARLPASRRAPSFERIGRAFKNPPRADTSLHWKRSVYPAFLKEPALLGTRAPNFILAAVLAMLVYRALRTIGATSTDSALLLMATMTLPEIFVRSGYGGYFAISALTFLLAAWLVVVAPGGNASFLAGFLAMLANQKSIIVGAASFLWSPRRSKDLWLGLVTGGLAFAVYGLLVAPEDFVADHLLDHGLRRFSGVEAHAAGAPAYPSRAGLWLEFAQHFGWVWCFVAAAACIAAIAALLMRRFARESSTEGEELREMALLWILVGAIAFTATDWRQTKHLCKLVPAMSLVFGALLARSPRAARFALRAALVICVLWNARWIAKIAQDFSSFPMSTIW